MTIQNKESFIRINAKVRLFNGYAVCQKLLGILLILKKMNILLKRTHIFRSCVCWDWIIVSRVLSSQCLIVVYIGCSNVVLLGNYSRNTIFRIFRSAWVRYFGYIWNISNHFLLLMAHYCMLYIILIFFNPWQSS